MADQNAGGLAGAQFDLSGGRVENCRFTGFRERLPGSVKAHAIAFWNDYSGAPLLQAEAVGNIIEDCYTGIQIGGAPDAKSFDFAIADNVISGVGPAITFEMACGIYIWEGAAGEVVRNTISGYSYVGDDWSTRGTPFSFGILGFGDGFPDHVRPLEPIRFADNVLRSNQVHVAFFKGDQGVFEDNTFKGYLPGTKPPLAVVPGGLWFSGGNVVVRRNHFSDLEQGIYLGGTNSIVGDALGHAINAQLTDNRFCDVANPTYSEPGASSTEEGTLACPFPDPVLRLSWPGIDEGFSVQSAPTPSGPWSTLDATPVRQDGQNNVTVPAASDQQFFRLAKP